MLRRAFSACSSAAPRTVTGTLPYLSLGTVPYGKALALQRHLVKRRHDLNHDSHDPNDPTIRDVLLLVQHPPTFTAGRRIKGGQITFHGPGQLVGYPILDIRDYQLNVRCYVSYLEKAVIETCRRYGVQAKTTENTGVWVDDNHKIAALGVQLQRYVSSHGLAINCDVDLSWFKEIVPCGLAEKATTSLSEQLNRNITVDEVLPQFVDSFGLTFGRNMVDARIGRGTKTTARGASSHFG
ncbi:unnamed protein product [Umbelopsis ramanniana]